MKNWIKFCVVLLMVFTACKLENKKDNNNKEVKKELASYDVFGEKITKENALNSMEMLEKFEKMNVGDTIDVKFASKIKEVCSKKGCWMILPLNKNEDTRVTFKDYGFFMPLDSKDREVILEGKATVKLTPIKDLKHYAEDAGKSKEEIAKITEPKKEYIFEANGVLMKK